MASSGGNTYLGLDLSTQGLKGILVNEDLKIIQEIAVSFDRDLPNFETIDGVHRHHDGQTVTSPVMLWVSSIDLLLEKMKASSIDFSKIKALSASGQQHGTVYWKLRAESKLANLNSENSLSEQLKDAFAIQECPVWMDASTTKYSRSLEASFGGALELAKVTGSSAYERFSGSQIAKIYHEHQDDYNECEQISLVSSFITTIFLEKYCPIDLSDGSGMNLLNIKTRGWETKALKACARDLDKRLLDPIPSSTVVGSISNYMHKRYGFSNGCKVVAATGDNPSSLAGMCLHKGSIAMSLGTSDTLILWTETANPAAEGHVFVNPVNETEYMAMLCFKNGSLAREKVRQQAGCTSWEEFNALLKKTRPGNDGHVAVYFFDTEIIPFAQGLYRWNASDNPVQCFPAEIEARAVIEGQFMAKLVHAQKFGFNIDGSTKILATGGASVNSAILQILADVFNASVYVSSLTSNSACLGAAYRAKHALLKRARNESFEDTVKGLAEYELVARANAGSHAVYTSLCQRYAALEQSICSQRHDTLSS